jgi:PACS-1 cytosolic sorting protein
MRLGKKKEKDRDVEKGQCVDNIARLICSPKQSHLAPLRGIKFEKKKKNSLSIYFIVNPSHV